MPENLPKMPRSASPIARSGAGDISERELSRERYTLQTTPPARMQPANPKKQLFSVPVNKFTAKSTRPSPNLARIRSCLEEIRGRTTAQPAKIGAKAVSLEDLTPTKRIKRDRSDMPAVRSPLHGVVEEQAAAKVSRFMLVAAWRRRRHEVRCLRRTLETQVSCSERLRIQVCTLKSLLDSDNAKVRLAIRELERLKQLLRDKDIEKAILEREKRALEDDVSAAEDRASELSIGWRNCRNELEGVRAAAARCEHALALERAGLGDARAQRDLARRRLSILEEELAQHEGALLAAECDVTALRKEAAEKQDLLEQTCQLLREEREGRERLACESRALRDEAGALRDELAARAEQLRRVQRQLDWWPRPLTRLLGMARSWLRHPMSMPEVIFWTLIPARQGC